MVILSVDYGDARTGIAVCDKLELLASPAAVLAETYAPKLAQMIAEEAKKARRTGNCARPAAEYGWKRRLPRAKMPCVCLAIGRSMRYSR